MPNLDLSGSDQNILFAKCEIYGLSGLIGNLLRSCLENRKQIESMNRQESSIELVGTGAPQCSVIGTFLFFIYLNDLGVDETKSNLTLFADDCSLLHNEKLDEGNEDVNIKYK